MTCEKNSERTTMAATGAAVIMLQRRVTDSTIVAASAKPIHHAPNHSNGSPTTIAREPHAFSSAMAAGIT